MATPNAHDNASHKPQTQRLPSISQFNIVTKHEIVAEADPLSAHNVDILRLALPLSIWRKTFHSARHCQEMKSKLIKSANSMQKASLHLHLIIKSLVLVIATPASLET
jgi:hypothetical protein